MMEKRLLYVKARFPGRLKEMSNDVAAYCAAEMEAAETKPTYERAAKEMRKKMENLETSEKKIELRQKFNEERKEKAEAYRVIWSKVEEQKKKISEKLSRLEPGNIPSEPNKEL